MTVCAYCCIVVEYCGKKSIGVKCRGVNEQRSMSNLRQKSDCVPGATEKPTPPKFEGIWFEPQPRRLFSVFFFFFLSFRYLFFFHFNLHSPSKDIFRVIAHLRTFDDEALFVVLCLVSTTRSMLTHKKGVPKIDVLILSPVWNSTSLNQTSDLKSPDVFP